MSSTTRATEDFFLASKRSEIALLKQLMASCELVTRVSNLIHELQRERGLSNVFLASKGKRFLHQRLDHIPFSMQAETALRDSFQQLDLDTAHRIGSARLFNNIAYVLHGLDGLTALRHAIEQQTLSATDSTLAFSRLIAALLSVIFEAADISDDPEITKALVAMFNFMQGKEYAGQERAWAVIGFAAGEFQQEQLLRLNDLIESQRHSFHTFEEFSQPAHLDDWQALASSDITQELSRLRQVIARTAPGAELPSAFSEVWYDVATQRIDRMQLLERRLADALLQLGRQRIRQANKELKKHHDNLELIASLQEPHASPLTTLLDPELLAAGDPSGANGVGTEWVRSIYGLVQQQAEGLKQMSHELAEARQALYERKRLERAKGLLMQHKGLTEEQAFRTLQQASMTLNTRLLDVAEHVITDLERPNTGQAFRPSPKSGR